jgi:RNA polymerase sigma-70 factor (ECF subfamily)
VETTGAMPSPFRAEPRAAAKLPALRPLAFEEIYRAYFDEVYRWTRALGGPDAERDDLVQDVFLIVHRRLPEFDGKNLAGWLYQITRHRVRDFRRLRWFRLFLSKSQVEDNLVSPALGPEAALGHKERAAVLARWLAKLPEAQRAAFVLFEIEGYSGEEIARLQGAPLNTVWARIHKAREKLTASAASLRAVRPPGATRYAKSGKGPAGEQS